MNGLSPTPIYVRATYSGGDRDLLLVDDVITGLQGEVFCSAEAPNGARGEGILSAGPDGIARAQLERLFADTPPAIFAPGGGSYDPIGADTRFSVGLTEGKSTKTTADWKAAAVEGPMQLSGIRLEHCRTAAQSLHLQFWSDSGPSFVVAVPPSSTLFAVPDAHAALAPVRPILVGGKLDSAYWGFVQRRFGRAARVLGDYIVENAMTDGDPSSGTIAVAAHRLLQSVGTGREDKHAAWIQEALDSAPASGDLAVLRWCLMVAGLRESDLQARAVAFEKAADAIRHGTCIYTEVHRLFIERMTLGFTEFATLNGQGVARSGPLLETLRWIKSLAGASLWDAEFVSFRGLDPDTPDRQALGSRIMNRDIRNPEATMLLADMVAANNALLQARAPGTREKEMSLELVVDNEAPRPAASIAPTLDERAPRRIRGKRGGAGRGPAPNMSAPDGVGWPGRAFRGNEADSSPARGRDHGSRGSRRDRRGSHGQDEGGEELIEKLVHINRVSKTVKGGKRFGFAALVVVGDGKGRAGFGHGKAREVPEAISKATAAAKKAMIRVPLREGRTLHHDGNGHFGAGKVTLRSAPAGTGIIAGGPMRAIFESLGVADVVTKSVGTSNPYNMIRATFAALGEQTSPKSVAARRGKKIADLLGRGGARNATDTVEAAVAVVNILPAE